ncbi:PKS-NRPS hybrid synthetase [Dissostichus eleginoides]|uniref:PKS-NRPS hybrid synthetase n=1 Tax=Dissostichus eleginoides TaxID=100907 RepID=A0AAD9CRS5_DISEL|nr:PKS-NRPS hybrid synthetase [Dissostichus eleginoides]
MIVIKGEHGHLKTFTCKMKNPVSEEESAAHMILFLPADSGLWIKCLGAVMIPGSPRPAGGRGVRVWRNKRLSGN